MSINKWQTGFTLVEVMVAVLVLSLGLLGLAGMQATSLKNNSVAAARGQATLLAYDMIDRMRANKTVALAGSYDNALDTAPTSGGSDCQANNATCDAATMAAYDLNQWKCLLGKWSSDGVCSATLNIDRGLLPDGDGSIAINGNVVAIGVQWSEVIWKDGQRQLTPFVLSISAEL
ncbi:Type IV fimbrial biogenesis protein PilV [hydrothermal vent metagenome]|uniref:Type IV fimbrial biogenesis protein PilV n=1 Tax=hydrothermal vent metagenome TaxID=652676 RepID=A0A3B0YJC7_9ZZZZ